MNLQTKDRYEISQDDGSRKIDEWIKTRQLLITACENHSAN